MIMYSAARTSGRRSSSSDGRPAGKDTEPSSAPKIRQSSSFSSISFYKIRKSGKNEGTFPGWPAVGKPECNSALKRPVFSKTGNGCIQYLGIAADEPARFGNLTDTKKSPLVEAGWDEAHCRKWCEENGLLSPIYTTATRGGCWFCHNQGVQQLRLLRRDYPDLWDLMLKWDKDSPVTFHADGHTVHDFDRRFQLEDEGFIKPGERFRWDMLDSELINYRLF